MAKRKRADDKGKKEPKKNNSAQKTETVKEEKETKPKVKKETKGKFELFSCEDGLSRCAWCVSNQLNLKHHDEEWGVPQHEDQKLFEFLCLEGAQAGLSWSTILAKRAAYHAAFDGFDPRKVAKYDDKKRDELMKNDKIIRNKAKIDAFIVNASAFLKVQEEFGSFDAYIWKFSNGKTINRNRKHGDACQGLSSESEEMSKELKNRGFKFCGPMICYSFMQAVGMIDDHVAGCFRKPC